MFLQVFLFPSFLPILYRITGGSLPSPGLDHDPMLGLSPHRGKLQGDEKTLGGFPVQFLIVVVSKNLKYSVIYFYFIF